MADGEHGFLGLTHNPFSTDSNDFFEGAGRKAILEQLRHLGQWSRRTTLVTGPLGVGKSSVFRQLSMTLEPRVKAARINGVLVNTLREVLSAVAQGVGASVSSDANSQTLAEVLATYFIGQERQGRYCLILVDDAHLLDFGSIEELLKLTRNSPVRLCLFGEPSLVTSLARPAQRQELNWHEIRIAALTLVEIEEYLAWKLSLAQFRGKLPFDRSQLAKVLKMSGGLPAQVNQIGADLVDRLESGQPDRSGARFPVAHGLVVVLLVVVVSLAYLVLAGIEPDAERDRHEDVATQRSTLPLPGAAGSGGDAAGDGERATGSDGADTAGSTDSGAALSASTLDPVELPAVAEPEELAPVLTPMPEPASLQGSSARAASEVVTPVVPATLPATPPATKVDAAAPEPRTPPASRDAQWLLARPASAFTVQLASFSTEERLVQYLGQQKDPGQFAWYPIERGGKRLFVVTYGQFDTKADAERATTALPAETGKVEPWVRPMAMVQDAVRAGPG